MTLIKEGYDEFKRFRRDRELNTTPYMTLEGKNEFIKKPAKSLKVGDFVQIDAGKRIPADLLLLYTSEKSGSVFIKTDQLDGETDWKLRKAVNFTQTMYKQGADLKSEFI